MSESRPKCLFQYLHFWNKINSIPLTDYFYTFKNLCWHQGKGVIFIFIGKGKSRYTHTHTHTLQIALKFPSRHRKIQSVFVKEMAFIINLNLESKGMFTANGKWSSWKCFTGLPLQLMIHHRIFSLEIWSYSFFPCLCADHGMNKHTELPGIWKTYNISRDMWKITASRSIWNVFLLNRNFFFYCYYL